MAAADEPLPDAAPLPGAGESPRRRSLRRRGPRPMLLEQRFMFDGAAVAVAGADLLHDRSTEAPHTVPARDTAASASPAAEPVAYAEPARFIGAPAAQPARQLLFVDAAVPAIAALATGVRPGVEVVVLDRMADPWAQMTQAVGRHAQLDAIHLLSHGAAGRLMLSGAEGRLYDALAHPAAADSLTQWRGHLAPEADILVYGCDVADGVSGQHSIGLIARLTGADVAASTDVTGTAALGGDWVLEAKTGPLEAGLPFDPAALAQGSWVLSAPISTRLDVVEGTQSTLVGREAFPAVDPAVTADSAAAQQIVYTLNGIPLYGRLELAGQAIGQDSTFTHAQVLNGELVYVHTAAGGSDQNTPDQFVASMNNPVAPGLPKDVVVTVAITPVNQAPTVGGGASAFRVFEGQPFAATSDGLARSLVGLAIVASSGGDPGDTTLDLRIASLPAHGLLHYAGPARLNGEPVTIDRVLTAADLADAGFVIAYADRGGLRYQHDGLDVGGVPPADGFDVVVTDGGGGTAQALSARATVAIQIDAVSDNPVLDLASTLAATVTINGPNQVFDVGGDDYRVVIGQTMLRVTDPDTDDANLSFFITRLPQDGRLLLNNTELAAGASFTMADIAAGRLQYVQTALNSGGANPQDDFALVVRDGTVSLHWDAAGEDHLRPGGLYTGSQPGDPLQTLNFQLTLAPTSAGSGGSGSTDPTPAPTSRLTTQYVGRPPTGQALGTLVEGGAVTIGRDMLQHGAGNVSADQIVYTLVGFGGTAGPWNGSLQRNGVALKVLDSFTQADIDAGLIRFVHDGGEDFASTVDFVVSAAGAREVTAATLALHAEPVNDLPTAVAAGALTVAEGGSIVISSARLALTDADDADSETHLENAPGDTTDQHGVNFALDNGVWGGDPLRWRVESLPTAGRLQVDVTGQGAWTDIAASDVAGKTLYDASLPEAGRLRYVHDGFESRNDSFRLVMRDRWGAEGAVTSVSFVITNANDAPEVAARPTLPDPEVTGRAANLAGGAPANQPLTELQEGGRTRLTAAMLQAYDPDSSPVQVQFRITAAPSAGGLQHSADGISFTMLGAGASFSQKQVQEGQIYVFHDGSEPPSHGYPGKPDDRFVFKLSDGAREQQDNEFWIYVEPVNDAPAVDLDPAAVGTGRTLTWTESANAPHLPVHLTPTAVVSDPDGATHSALRLTLTGLRDGNAEALIVGETVLELGGDREPVDFGSLRVSYEVASATLTAVPRSGASTPAADFQALLRDLRYVHQGDRPTSGARTVAVTLTDAGLDGSSNGAGTATSAPATMVIDVVAVNDQPELGLTASLTFYENALNAAAQPIVPSATLSDTDSDDYGGGSLRITGLVAGQDQVGLPTQADSLPGQVRVQGGQVQVHESGAWKTIGQLTGGDGTDLRIDFTSAAQRADVEQVLRQLQVTNLSDDPGAERTLIWLLDDGDGGTVRSASVHVAIAAENDAPVLTVGSGDAATATRAETEAPLTASGTLTLVDPDTADTVTVTVSGAVLEASPGVVLPSTAQVLAMLTLEGHVGNTADAGSARNLAWQFESSPPAFNGLAEGDTLVIRYMLQATDSSSAAATATRELAITVLGRNDQPVLTVLDVTGTVIEDPLTGGPYDLRDGGSFEYADPDTTDLAQISLAWLGATHSAGGTIGAALSGALAQAVSLSGTGLGGNLRAGAIDWTFALDPSWVQGLAEGESITAAWRVTVTDDSGTANAAATQDIAVTVVGRNDAPTVTPIDTSGAVDENEPGLDGLLRDSGSAAFGDVDAADAVNVSAVLHAVGTSGGALLDGRLLQALQTGFTLGGHGVGVPAAAGTVRWDLTLDSALVQPLALGQALSAVWRLSFQDRHGAVTTQDVTVSIAGANDGPTLVATAAPPLVETADASAQTLVASGRLDLDDDDTGDHLVLAADYKEDAVWTAGTLDPSQIAALAVGTFRVDPAPAGLPGISQWHYAAPEVDLDFLGHGEAISLGFTVTASDSAGALAATVVRLRIDGRNDAPAVVDAQLSAELTEDASSGTSAALRGSGWLQFSDADAKDQVSAGTQFLGVSVQGGARVDTALATALASALTLAGDGVSAGAPQGTLNWAFALDDALVSHLAPGQSLTATWRLTLVDDSGSTDARTERDVTVTIHGANSAPTLTGENPADFVEALDARAQTLEQAGTLQVTDPDAGARLRLEVSYNGDLQWSGGTLDPSIASALTSAALTLSIDELDAPGSARWEYLAGGLDLDFLAPGETVRFSYTVNASDSDGETAASTLLFTLVGTGETPDLSMVDLTGSVTEDRTSGTPAQLRDSGLAGFAGLNGGVPPTVTSQLLDATPTGSAAVDALWTAALAAAFDTGELQVDTATGLGLVPWTFALDNGLAQGLGAGDSIVARWRISLASDPTVSEVVTVTVVGVNDAPTIAAAMLTAAVVEDQTLETPGRLRAAGSLDFADTDRGDRIQAGVALHSLSATSGLAIGPTLTTALAQAMTLEGAGTDGAAESGRVSWAFGLDNGLVQHLGEGDAITAIWRLSLTDDSGSTRATSFRDLVVTITGANDAPAIVSVDVLGGVTAGVTTGTPALLRDSGSIDFTDVDATDLLSAGVALHSVARGNGAPADAALDAALAQALTLTGPGATTKANAGTLAWAFALDSALAQSLAPGQTVTATWRVSLGDDSGGPDAIRTQDVVVTLTGANDAPSIVAADLDGEVVEDTTSGTPALLRDSGTLVFADSDSGQLVRADVVWLGSSASAGVTVSSALAQALASALTLSGDGLGAGAPAGTLRWDFALDDALAQTLGAGDRVTGTWRIRLDDGSGGTGAVSTRDLHITVVGANDAPAVLSADLEGAVTEDLTAGAPAMLREAGTLAWADADATDLVRVSVATPTMTGSPGVLLDHPDGFALSMALAQALTVSGAGTGATAAAAAGGSVGWVFALDPAYTQFLGADESVTVTWRLTLTDDSGRPNASTARDLVITIHGRNDTPTVSAVDVEGTVGADQVTGSPARLRDSGSVHFSDPDRLDRVQASVALQGVVRHGGAPADAALDAALAQALTLSGPGSGAPSPAGTLGWAFELDPAFAQALAPGQTVTATWRISFTDDSGGPGTTRTQDVSITIIGANDAPVVGAADLTGLLTEDMPSGERGQLRDGGTLAFSDPDVGQRVRAELVWLGSSASAGLTVSGALADALRNALTLSGDGLGAGAAAGTLRWDVALDNALVQSLGAGDSVVARWQLRLADDANPGDAVVTRELTVTVEGRNDAPTDLGESRDVGLGQTVSGPLLTANSSDVDGDALRLHSVDGVGFSELAASTDPAHPAGEGWRQRTLEHGTLYVQQDGRADYRHGGRSFLVTPLDVPGRLEIRQQDGTWIELQGPASISLDALRSGGLRYTPAASEGTLALATVAKITERDWRSDGFTYRVSDGQAASAPVQVAYTVTSGRELLGSDIRPAPDGDVDGIASRVEAALAGRVTGLDGLQPRPHVLLPAHLGLATGGDGYTLTLRAEFEGDLNQDGVADAFQPAVTTFAWTSHVQFEIANADPAALESTRAIVTLVAAANLDETPTAHANVQLSAVEVRSMSATQSAAFEARFGFSSLWSPLTFGARLASDAGADAAPVDIDLERDGAQWRFTIDLSRSGEMASDFVGYVKWVDQATIDAYRNAGLDLLDLDGRAIESPGFVDFTRREAGGDGARLYTDPEGRLWLDIVITDNRFGDADLALGRIVDPGMPAFVNEADDRRPLTVSSPAVNEASPWACFEVSGAARQIVSLSLVAGSATGGGVDFGSTDARNLQVSIDGGQTWVDHASGTVQLPESGRLLARTPVIDDRFHDPAETIVLEARTTGGSLFSGTATVRDDGAGVVFRADGSIDTHAWRSDDRPAPPPTATLRAAAASAVVTSGPMTATGFADLGRTAIAAFDSALQPTRPSTLLPERPPPGDTLTSAAGFRVVVIESSRPGLSVYQPVADQIFPSNRTATFSIPSDTFAHTAPDAVLRLEARLSNGRGLPAWIQFDARTGTFTVTPPAGFAGELELRITARDQDGREASTVVKIKVTSGVMVNPGRPSLSEQLGTATPGGRQTASLPRAVDRPPGGTDRSDANALPRARR